MNWPAREIKQPEIGGFALAVSVLSNVLMMRIAIALLIPATLSLARGQDVLLEPDYAKSYIVARTGKAGLLAFAAGHRHGIIADEWSAQLCLEKSDWARSRAVIMIPTASLRIDTPRALRLAQLESKGPSAKDVAKIQKQMLSPENLAADSHPEIRFVSSGIERKSPETLVVKGTLTMRGRPRGVTIPIKVTSLNSGFQFSGRFSIKQTDFGIRPATVAGVVKVKDEVEILFDIRATAANRPCR